MDWSITHEILIHSKKIVLFHNLLLYSYMKWQYKKQTHLSERLVITNLLDQIFLSIEKIFI
jgi:hypothetical protein